METNYKNVNQEISRNHRRGSLWRKWDLHIHTPASLVQEYGENNDSTWNLFFEDLEKLPPEIKVIGINDYIFIDGYKKVRNAKEQGRLPNIDLILPVVELRLNKFGGTNSELSRVNFHIIFSDEIKPEIIEQHFLNALPSKYQLSPEFSYLKTQWQALATRDSLIELGQLITQSIPLEKRTQLPSSLKLGFNNLNFDRDAILDVLESHYFRDKFFTAVGKTEWENIRWSQSIADKKDIVNRANFVFTSAKTIASAIKSKDSLSSQGVNDCLLDCSDAHYFSSSSQHNRIGKCFTWIKADTTFNGLRQVLNEPKQRCFIGDIPETLRRTQTSPTKYIKSLSIERTGELPANETWFNNIKLDFNHELVAIIGGQGNGKSALADIIALLGNSQCKESFSFLTIEKFCTKKNNRAKYFEATLTWEDKTAVTKNLNDITEYNEQERVKYVPQIFFDLVCNETDFEGGKFEQELKKVIFSHIHETERNGCLSIDDLIAYRTNEIQITLDTLKSQLRDINRKTEEFEELISEEHQQEIRQKLEKKNHELSIHKQNPPTIVKPIDSDTEAQLNIEKLQLQKEEISKQIEEINRQLTEENILQTEIGKGIQKIDNFIRQYDDFKRQWCEQINLPGVDFTELVRFETNKLPLSKILSECKERIVKLREESVLYDSHREALEAEIDRKRTELDESAREYQDYLQELERYNERERDILGDTGKSDSIKAYETELNRILTDIPQQILQEKESRLRKAQEIFREIIKLANLYKDLYKPVQSFIDGEEWVREKYKLEFEVLINPMDSFIPNFLEHINQQARGTFHTDANLKLKEILERYDFSEEDDIVDFLNHVIELLEFRDSDRSEPLKIVKQLRKTKSVQAFYNFLFSLEYLQPNYALRLSGKKLKQLSPGERGGLLLIFYLLIDRDDCPLIIDQPEQNLNNQSIYETLIRCIQEAKKRRQIFVITHNPNLAVVCDAEQIIHASIDKDSNHLVTYVSGSIENPNINSVVVNVLEGTYPAFRNRDAKYLERGIQN